MNATSTGPTFQSMGSKGRSEVGMVRHTAPGLPVKLCIQIVRGNHRAYSRLDSTRDVLVAESSIEYPKALSLSAQGLTQQQDAGGKCLRKDLPRDQFWVSWRVAVEYLCLQPSKLLELLTCTGGESCYPTQVVAT
jgi:hypothetical protein